MGVTDKMTGAELILTRAMSGGKLKRYELQQRLCSYTEQHPI
jgi:hypothetical protein